ncbi:hypothetical protein [Psychroflexus tropicus]|uniref:hypothetical protein n=1 Tax=Psychroflexus tropicus TaxID=197345 RepID=UPI00047773FC|nr:hypothetical protein [Psychroflexus tropicus]
MKSLYRYVIAIIFILIAGYFISNFIIANKIESLLEEENSIAYSSLKVNSLIGNLNVRDFEYKTEGKKININQIDLNVDLIHYLFQKDIKIDVVTAENLSIDVDLSSSKNSTAKKAEFDITSIKKIELSNIDLILRKNDKVLFKASKANINAEDLTWPLDQNYKWLNNKSLDIRASTLFYDLDDLHIMKSEAFSFKGESLAFSDFEINPKYTTSEYVNHISKEKDLMNFKAKAIKINKFSFQSKDSLKHILSKHIQIENSDFSIFRDKTIRDDTSVKPLYSRALRDLDFLLEIDSISISKLNLTYQELLQKNHKPGKITFNAIHGQITNLHNITKRKDSMIFANFKAKFTDQSDIHFKLKLLADSDNFEVNTLITKVEDRSINGFFAPAMQMELDGTIDKIEASFQGNNTELNGSFTMAYKKLKLNVLEKDGSKNNFASLLSNALVQNNNVNHSFELKHIERDRSKSFWNYIWTFHSKGLRRALL